MTPPRQAVLLAAGEGQRLRPLTEHVPKALLPIDGRPVIETLMHQLARCGIESFTIVIGHRGTMVRSSLPDLVPRGVDIRIVEQPERRGSAHALRCALDAGLEHRTAIVAATDTVFRDADVDSLIERFVAVRPQVAMGMRRWPVAELPHRSCVVVDDDLRVRVVIEKPPAAAGTTGLAGSPLYIFDASFWPYVQRITPQGGIYELATGLQSAIDDGHVVQGVEVRNTRDLTRPDDILRHNFPYLDRLLTTGDPDA